MIVECEITYDMYSYEDGYYKVTNSGFIDRTQIYSELLKLNLGFIRLDIDGYMIDIFCNRIHEIRYTVGGHEVVIDGSPFYGKYFDKEENEPKLIAQRKQPKSTLKRQETNNRGIRIRRPNRIIEENKSWYIDNVLKKL